MKKSSAKIHKFLSDFSFLVTSNQNQTLNISILKLFLIDIPNYIPSNCSEEMPFGKEAFQFIQEKIANTNNINFLEFFSKNQIIFAKILIKSKDLGLSLLENGLAKFNNNCEENFLNNDLKETMEAYKEAEEKAKLKNIGIWGSNITQLKLNNFYIKINPSDSKIEDFYEKECGKNIEAKIENFVKEKSEFLSNYFIN